MTPQVRKLKQQFHLDLSLGLLPVSEAHRRIDELVRRTEQYCAHDTCLTHAEAFDKLEALILALNTHLNTRSH